MRQAVRIFFCSLAALLLVLPSSKGQSFSPSSIQGLSLWLRADSLLLNGQNVISWFDRSGGNYAAQQANTTNQPIIQLSNELSGLPVVSFDGTNDFMSNNNAPLGTQTTFTFFALLKSNIFANFKCIYHNAPSSVNSYYITAANSNFFRFHTSLAAANFSVSSVQGQYYLISITYNISDPSIKGRFYINSNPAGTGTMSIATNTGLGYFLGRRADGSYYFSGSIAEIITYNNALHDTNRLKVERYLYERYSPPLDLGSDIVTTSFCPVSLTTDTRFKTFLWSNGDTTSATTIYSPGRYWLRANDLFGKIHYDTINVIGPSRALNSSDTNICLGETLILKPTTNNLNKYTFFWQNGSTDSTFHVTSAGNFWCKITDSAGCYVYSDTITVQIDSFAQTVTLGPDTSICSGNIIGWYHTGQKTEPYNFSWSTGSTDSTIAITNSGQYYCVIANNNGCAFIDTINVTVSGNAPIADYFSDTVCHLTPTSFTDMSYSTSPDTIISWEWIFGTGDTTSVQNPNYIFQNSGSYNCTLKVTTNNGCSGYTSKSVLIKPNPMPSITADTGCILQPIQFFGSAVPPPGTSISSWIWDFDDNSFDSIQNTTHLYASPGQYNITLTVGASNGCISSDTLPLMVLSSYNLPSSFNTHLPHDNAQISSSSILFQWQQSNYANKYRVRVATDSLFTAIVRDTVLSITSCTFIFANPTKYYWRVIAYNLCNDSVISNSSAFRLFWPTTLSGLNLWYRGDSVLSNGQQVVSWLDLSGNNHHLIQTTGASQPTRNTIAEINSQPVIIFDGTNDYLSNNSAPYYNQKQFSFFAVCKPAAFSSFKTIFQNSSSSNNSFRVTAANSNYFRFHTSSAAINFNTAANPIKYHIISIVYDSSSSNQVNFFLNGNNAGGGSISITNSSSAGLSVGRRADAMDYYIGNIAEILTYDHPLSNSHRQMVESYLRFRYAPPLNLGPDINVSYGFCSTVLDASSRFQNFLWSTGDTTQTIQVNKSGTYWVTAQDIFGYFSSDTVHVNYPNTFLYASNTTLCLYDTATIIPPHYNNPYYSFLWQDYSSTTVYNATQAGNYYTKITDTLGCHQYSDTVAISIDSFPISLSLGGDDSLCSGNHLYANFNPFPLGNVNYIWSNGSTLDNTIVSSSGNYSLTVTNQNNCISIDTVYISITGTAPTVNFHSDTVCFGSITSFTDASSVIMPDSIISWSWDFGDGNGSQLQNPSNLFTSYGPHSVNLQVVTNSGCSNAITHDVILKTNPIASFFVSNACVNSPFQFFDLSSTIGNDQLTNWAWNFGNGDTSYTQNPFITFTTPGNYVVTLSVANQNGCIDTSSQIITVVNSAPIPLPPYIIAPLNDITLNSTYIHFHWLPALNSTYHKIQIFSDSTLTNKIFEQSQLYTDNLNIQLNWGSYFWKLISFNICGDSTMSSIQKFHVFNPTNISGLNLWLRADSTQVNNNLIEKWYDLSGNNYHCYQSNSLQRPTRSFKGLLNNNYSINFDGNNDYLRDTLAPYSNQKRWSLFLVCSPLLFTNFKCLFQNSASSNNSFYITAATNNFFRFHIATAAQNFSIPTVPGRYNILNVIYDSASSTQKAKFYINNMLAGSANLSIPNSNTTGYSIGSRSDNSYWYSGEIAEVIFYNSPLQETQRQQVVNYLRNRYAPPLSLGPDIYMPYGMCDTLLAVDTRFININWSTGDTNNTIQIVHPGQYWVTAEDIFGFIHTDSINVIMPSPNLNNSTICLNSSITYSVNMGSGYSYLWSDMTTNPDYTISLPGFYHLTVYDTVGCSKTFFFTVAVDSFPVLASLGPDRKACQGDLLGLASGAMQTVSYQWSDGSGNSLLLINDPPGSTPLYSVTVTNNIGCVAEDSITLLINGVAPQPAFSADSVCEGLPTHFMDYSSVAPPYQIISWLWDFGDSSSSVAQLPLHTYSSYGTPLVSLTVTTDSGCVKTLSQAVLVWSKPQAWFLPSNGCVGAGVPFSDQTYSALGSVNSWSWDFGDPGSGGANTSTLQHPVHNYMQTGFYDVSIAVGTIGGCSDTLVRSIDIKDAPTPDFAYTNACLGEAVYFSDITQTQPWTQILEWKWHFGDGDSSTLVNPVHIFTQAGTFNVSLSVKSLNGCRVTVSKPVIVHAFPEAAFATSSICLQTPFTFTDQSTASTDTIISWFWRFGDGNSSSLASPTHIYQDTGMYTVSLNVSTPYGCADSVMQQVQVHPLPSALFSFSPEYGIPPQTVSFSNTSTGAQSYLWQFGDGQTSTESNPEHLYSSLGIYLAGLTATSSYGCSDTAFATIFMIPSSADIKIINAYAEIIGGFMELSADVINTGSRRADIINFTAQPEGGSVISERWTGALHPGESFNYKFQSRFGVPAGSSTNFACITAYAEGIGEDVSPSDNTFCAVLNDELMIAGPDPNPGNGIFSFGVITPIAGQLEISLFNESGKEVMKLFSGISVKGFNRFDTDATQLGPGFYTLRIVFRDTALYRKLILY